MAFLQVEDLLGGYEVIVFPKVFQTYAQLLQENRVLLIKGRVSIREDEQPKLIAESFSELSKNATDKKAEPVSSRREPYMRNASQSAFQGKQQDHSQNTLQGSPQSNIQGSTRSTLEKSPQSSAPVAPRLGIRYAGNENDEGYKRLLAALAYFHGPMQVVIFLPSQKKNVVLSTEYCVDPANDILKEISAICGKDNMAIF